MLLDCIFYIAGIVSIISWDSCHFFVQAEDGIRYLVRSRGLGDVYKRQDLTCRTSSTTGRTRI